MPNIDRYAYFFTSGTNHVAFMSLALAAAAIACTVLTGCGGGNGSGSSSSLATTKAAPGIYETVSVNSFVFHELTIPSSSQEAQLTGAGFGFYKNGSFKFLPADAAPELFPVVGSYQQAGNTYTFQGKSTYNPGDGTTYVDVNGTMDFSGASPVIHLFWSDGNGSGAIVDGGTFGSSAAEASESYITVELIGPAPY